MHACMHVYVCVEEQHGLLVQSMAGYRKRIPVCFFCICVCAYVCILYTYTYIYTYSPCRPLKCAHLTRLVAACLSFCFHIRISSHIMTCGSDPFFANGSDLDVDVCRSAVRLPLPAGSSASYFYFSSHSD